ncbi:MAG: serine/threonine protein kinase [Phycisphaera sp.]|nr:MAG: serine/threonine protein kinase [Phycisphaera sp.]
MISTERFTFLDSRCQDEAETLLNLSHHVESLTSAEQAVSLNELLDAFPEARDNPVLLDAVIEHAIDYVCRDGTDVSTATEAIASRHPHYASAIRRAGCLSLILDSSQDEVPETITLGIGHRIGPIDDNGLPRYEIVEACGRGSTAVIYKAVDRKMSDAHHTSLVAIKIFDSNSLRPDQLHSEGVLASIAGHPNVVQVFDRGTINDRQQYVAMEYSCIGSLHDLQVREYRQIVRLIRDVALGLHAAHSMGVVHGDIKPDNILLFGVAEDNEHLVPKVSDFGTSKSLKLGRAPVQDNSSYSDAGNLAFMAPEVWAGAHPTIQSDVYSLASMLHYLITGSLISRQPSASSNITYKSRFGKYRLNTIINDATAPSPAHRTSSAIEFANRLDAWLTDQPITGIDRLPHKMLLHSIRRPVMSTAAVALILFLVIGVIGGAHAWKGWVYESARRTAASNVSVWHERFNPAFSDRSSIFDLASRYALANSIDDTGAFDWARTVAPDIETEIAQLLALHDSLPENSIDSILVREQLIFRMLHSRERHPDIGVLIDEQYHALTNSNLLTAEDAEQIDIFLAVLAVKEAVMEQVKKTDYARLDMDLHLATLSEFLNSKGLFNPSGLERSARRDPRVRLASRAAHWLSSEKMMDHAELHAALDREYGE